MSRTLFSSKAAPAFIFVTAALDVVAMGIILPVLPVLIEQLAGSNSKAGLVNGSFVALWALMQFVASPLIGALSDRFGRRPLILLSTAGMAIAYCIMATAPNLWWLAVGRMIVGITSASLVTVNAYMADVTPPAKRARAYGFIGAAFSGGLIAGPLLGGVFSEISPRAPFWIAGALSAAAFLYGAFVLPESLTAGRRMKFSWRRANPLGAIKLLRAREGLLRLSLVNLVMYFGLYVISAVLVLYASFRYGWSAKETGALLALVGVLDVVVQSVLVGAVTRWLGERGTLICGLLSGALGLAGMGLAPTGALFVLAIVPTALRCLAVPALQSLMTRRVSESEQGQLQGANMSLASLAGVVAPVFFGFVYAMSVNGGSASSGVAFLIAAAVFLAAAAAGYGVRTEKACDSWDRHAIDMAKPSAQRS